MLFADNLILKINGKDLTINELFLVLIVIHTTIYYLCKLPTIVVTLK